MRYLLDTHALHAAADAHAAKPLSPRARELIGGCARDDLAISAITLLELARHLRNGVINTGDHRRWMERIEESVTVVPITPSLADSSVSMPWRRQDNREHTDPADRLIVATAIRYQLPIIGDDAEMRHISASHGFQLIW
ncbi:MAG TPA: PIN domain-containing protein [Opitutaceae bacterium]|nr:PIN domain-containing protein [Opitutaceae bacterium]